MSSPTSSLVARTVFGLLTAAVVSVPVASASTYSFRDYYIAIDSRPDMTGYYVNHPNPQFGRLTLLFAHDYPSPFQPTLNFTVNHYHRVGFLNYAPAPAGWTTPLPAGQTPTVVTSNARLPEGTYPPIKLVPGSGAFAGRLVSTDRPDDASDPSTEYDNFAFASVQKMRADAEAAEVDPGRFTNNFPSNFVPVSDVGTMFYSSRFAVPGQPGRVQARYTAPLTGAVVGLELVSLTPGLSITDTANNALFSGVGSTAVMGDGNTLDFTPVFSIDAATSALGVEYSATFRLVDLRPDAASRLLPSSTFTIATTAIPEPATLGLLAPAAMLLSRRRQRA